MMHRRRFLKTSAAATVAGTLAPRLVSGSAFAIDNDGNVPCRAITGLPGHHWFGYYDKLQFSPNGRYVLGMETMFEGRPPTSEDVIGIGMVDTEMNDRWIEFGTSRAWGWQQGCMLQWIPGEAPEVIWNDAEDDKDGRRFVSHILNVETGARRTLPMPVYALTPDGRYAVTTDFARIDRMRPGYGYVGGGGGFLDEQAPEEGGIYRVDLQTGDTELIVPYSAVAQVPHLETDVSDKWHYFNHLLVNTDGSRFLFLNRYRDFTLTDEMRADPEANAKYVSGKYTTRMFTAGLDGSDLYEIDTGDTSHIIWRDPEHILAWTRGQDRKRPDAWGDHQGLESGFWLLKDRTSEVELVGADVMTQNGHQTYVPNTNNEWILNDTYPSREDRKQTLYLYHIPTGREVILGRFYEPPAYSGEWRTDLHPRASRDGTKVCIDSTHEDGKGRQMYLLNISEIVQS